MDSHEYHIGYIDPFGMLHSKSKFVFWNGLTFSYSERIGFSKSEIQEQFKRAQWATPESIYIFHGLTILSDEDHRNILKGE